MYWMVSPGFGDCRADVAQGGGPDPKQVPRLALEGLIINQETTGETTEIKSGENSG